MPVYFYVAREKDGKKIDGTVTANNEEEVLNILQMQGRYVISISLYTPGVKSSSKRRKKKKMHAGIAADDFLFFARQLSVMLDAGVPLLRALDVIRKETSSMMFADVLSQVREDVASGWSLEKAVAKHPRVFNSLWVNIIRTGEQTGRLGFVLSKLADYIERANAFKKKIVSALVYPVILMVLTISALLFLTLFIIPQFETLFSAMNNRLPALTIIVMNFSKTLRSHFMVIVLGFVLSTLGIRFFLATPVGKNLWDHIILRIPVLGDFVLIGIMEKISSNMAILFESGVPIYLALDITEKSADNVVVEEKFSEIKEKVKKGMSLSVAMEESEFFEPLIIQMVSVGEEVGELPQMFNKVAEYYKDSLENALDRFTSMFEPFMLIFMAVVIGILLLSVFLPIFNMVNVNL